jgi:threonine dehydratase
VSVKVDAVRAYGATVDLVSTRNVPREVRVAQLSDAAPGAYVASAYDDPFVIAGNASLGRELAAHDFDVIVTPMGGGGLASGIIVGLREAGSRAEVVGAEPLIANDAARSFREGHIVANDQEPQTIADGARTRSLGKHNWAVLNGAIAGVVEVPEENIIEGVRVLFALVNLKAEPTGAVATGALLTEPGTFRGKRVCAIVSGGNADPVLYRKILAGEI